MNAILEEIVVRSSLPYFFMSPSLAAALCNGPCCEVFSIGTSDNTHIAPGSQGSSGKSINLVTYIKFRAESSLVTENIEIFIPRTPQDFILSIPINITGEDAADPTIGLVRCPRLAGGTIED